MAGVMTAPDPLEDWYRAAVAETMKPCPEYRRWTAKQPTDNRVPCPMCLDMYSPSYVGQHIRRAHPEAGDMPVDNGREGAA